MYCGTLSVKTDMRKTPRGAQNKSYRERICFAFSLECVVGKNPKTPKLSPMADDTVTQGGRRSGISSVYGTCIVIMFYGIDH